MVSSQSTFRLEPWCGEFTKYPVLSGIQLGRKCFQVWTHLSACTAGECEWGAVYVCMHLYIFVFIVYLCDVSVCVHIHAHMSVYVVCVTCGCLCACS